MSIFLSPEDYQTYMPVIQAVMQKRGISENATRSKLRLMFNIAYLTDRVDNPPEDFDEIEEALLYLIDGKWDEYKKLRATV